MIEKLWEELVALTHVLSRQTWKKIIGFFVLYVLPVVLFVGLADEVRDRDTLVFDEMILQAIHDFASHGLDNFALTVTDLGYTWWVGGLTVAGVLLLVYRHRLRDAAILVVGVTGSAIINLILKALFQRDRPELWERLVVENSFSFPSGHAMASCSLAVAAMVILWPTKWRWLSIMIGGIYMAVIGWTRMYLGVHYPSDIAAGWLIAFIWVMIAAAIIRRWRLKKV